MSETEIQPQSVDEHLLALQAGPRSFRFEVDTGVVVSDPTGDDDTIHFFMRDQDGREQDLSFESPIKARQGHRVSVLYASRKDGERAYPVAWGNHDTGKADFLKGQARVTVGNQLSLFFLSLAEGSAHAMGNLVPNNFLATLVLLPISLAFLAFGMACLAVGTLLGLSTESQARMITRRAEEIMSVIDRGFETPKAPRSLFKRVLKGIGMLFLVAFALLVGLMILVAIFE